MGEYKLLPKIKSPNDVKRLNEDDIPKLCNEIREKLVETVSVNGGHLSPNLGVVELTVALHRSFNFPKDSIVWDVGHQSYTHKLLTGRYESFDTLRQKGGISGFPKRSESKYDDFNTGHSSTSISAAFGIANAKLLNGDNSHTIAVIGDGSFTGGLAFEAMNNAGRFNKNFIVVLNDNKMSISKNVGAFPRYLTTVRIQPWYIRVKKNTEKVLSKIPLIGKPIKSFLSHGKSGIKNLVYKNTLFDCFGFTYLGPIDGHNVEELENAFAAAKKINAPVMIHVVTKKGKGYQPAEENPGEFHGIGQFDIDSGEPISSHKGFSSVFGKTMCDFAQQDKKICAITAAMSTGTGLSDFSKQYKERFFDVGIAEEHAVTFGCGLASRGMRPVFAVYSTFLQRSYDQLIHDSALGNIHLVLAVDRAGIVGSDGETHQGVFDVSMLNSIPNTTIFSPSYFIGLKKALGTAIYMCESLAVVRYPRGGELYCPEDYGEESIDYDIYGNKECKNLLITYGRLFSYACRAKEMLEESGIEICILKLCKIRPINNEAVEFASNFENVWFFEEGIKNGGIARNFSDLLQRTQFSGNYHIKAINDEFVKQMSVSEALAMLKLDSKGMFDVITKNLGENQLKMKKRLDILVYEKGFTDSREKAKAVIMAGQVYVDNQKADKCGSTYDENAEIEVRGNTQKYVSRGGLKLEKAINNFDFDLKDKITMDIGASTGGFTDCMLQNGAKKVYSIDVGYGQLAWKLRNDERVVNLERTNMRKVTREQVPDEIDFFSVDVSFISLKLILPVARELMAENAQAVCLIKPQFEAGREKVGKKGVVRDPSVHIEVVENIFNFCLENGFDVLNLDFSPIKGPEGNIEYLIHLRKSDEPKSYTDVTPEQLVENSHKELDKK